MDDIATHEEFYQMHKQIELEAINPSGYWSILTIPSYRKRDFLACFVQLAANSTGGLVINYYSMIIYTRLGLSGYMTSLLYAIYTLVGALGNLGSLLTVDKTGCRFVSRSQNTIGHATNFLAGITHWLHWLHDRCYSRDSYDR